MGLYLNPLIRLEIRSVAAFLYSSSSSYILFIHFHKSLNCMMWVYALSYIEKQIVWKIPAYSIGSTHNRWQGRVSRCKI
jgi:hypothetical protein